MPPAQEAEARLWQHVLAQWERSGLLALHEQMQAGGVDVNGNLQWTSTWAAHWPHASAPAEIFDPHSGEKQLVPSQGTHMTARLPAIQLPHEPRVITQLEHARAAVQRVVDECLRSEKAAERIIGIEMITQRPQRQKNERLMVLQVRAASQHGVLVSWKCSMCM